MKTIFMIMFFALTMSAFAQEGKDTVTYVYCEVVAVAKYGTSADKPFNVNLFYDFGSGIDNFIKDKNGKEINFESAVDAINYLAGFGWHLQTSTSFYMVQPSWRCVTHHFLKRAKYLAK